MWTLTEQRKLLAPFSFVIFALLIAVSPLHAQYVTTTIPAGTSPSAVALNPATNKIYVANYGSASVTVIDGATNSTTPVIVGTDPTAVAVNPVTNKIYVANYGSANVTVIDGATNSTTTVPAGTYPSSGGGEPGDQQDLRGESQQQQCDGDRRRDQRHNHGQPSGPTLMPWR